jgi:hypothetical protein
VSPASQRLDKLDITSFLFELIKQTKGQEGMKNVVLKSAIGELNNSANLNNIVFNLLQEIFFCFFDVIIPESATVDNNGFIFNVNEIDPTNMLSTDPNSPEGRHIYESNDAAKCINYLVYTALNATYETPVQYRKNGKLMFTLYYLGGNQFKMHIGKEYAGQKLSVWAEDYLQDVSFFNMPNFLAELLDIITGVVSVKTGKSKESAQQNATILTVMEKLFGFCDNQDNSGSNATNAVYNEMGTQERDMEPINISPKTYLENKENNNNTNAGNLFDLTSEEMLNIEDIANLRSQGKVRFSVCGNFEVGIDPNDVFAKLDQLFADAVKSGTTINANDGTTVPKFDNETVVPDINKVTAMIDNVLQDNIQNYTNSYDGNTQGSPNANDVVVNLPNIEAEFELSVVKAIPFAMTMMVISPQLLLLIKTASLIIGEEENNGVFTIDSVISKLSTFITKIGNDIWNGILSNIFNILVKELTGILTSLATRYITERFSNYIGILQFIMNLIKGLNLSANGCQSMLDIIMRLLSLNYFGPAMPIPPPLVYVGGMLKPGLNSVSVINNLKSSFADAGIETGATLSDGSENMLMKAFEIHTKTMITAVQQDASVQGLGMGATGPVQVYSQIS